MDANVRHLATALVVTSTIALTASVVGCGVSGQIDGDACEDPRLPASL